jgi:hypothetical protein
MNEAENDKLVKDLERVIGGKPIDDVAPLLVVAVARLLFIDAGGDKERMAFLVAKFLHHLSNAINDMWEEEVSDAARRKLN